MPAEPITVTVHIEEPPKRVFEYFTRPEALLRWMGEPAVLDPAAGGEFTVDIRGIPVRGRYLAVEPPPRPPAADQLGPHRIRPAATLRQSP